jgi:hypothetical protein
MKDMKEIEDSIFKKSLSYEYFWRGLVTNLIDSKKCQYWNNDLDKQRFIN